MDLHIHPIVQLAIGLLGTYALFRSVEEHCLSRLRRGDRDPHPSVWKDPVIFHPDDVNPVLPPQGKK